MIIAYENIIEDVTIGYSTQDSNYPWSTALLDTRLSRVGRTTDDAAEYISFTLDSYENIDIAVILAHNISSAATVKLQSSAFSDFSSLAVNEDMTRGDDCYYINNTNYDYDVSYSGEITYGGDTITYGGDPITATISGTTEYKFWRIYIDDSTNSDGYIEIGGIFLYTDYLTMPSFQRVFAFPRKSSAVATKSVSGQLYGDKRINYNSAKFDFNNVSHANKALINTFFDEMDLITPFILLVWENDLDEQQPIYCNLTEDLNWQKEDAQGILWKFSLPIEETF